MLPKLPMICNENLRELVSLDIRVVSSANCEILASCIGWEDLCLYNLALVVFSRQVRNSTDNMKRNGLSGYP